MALAFPQLQASQGVLSIHRPAIVIVTHSPGVADRLGSDDEPAGLPKDHLVIPKGLDEGSCSFADCLLIPSQGFA